MNGNQTPKRLRHAIVLALGLGISNVALSLGLGPIDVKSYLGQPMFATIRVDGLTSSTAKGMTVKLASPAAYKSRGIEMLPDHQQMRFALVPSGKGYVIRITSLGSIKEPFINFLLTISGNGNVVTREYAAFFNPDPTMEAGIAAGKSATVVSRTVTPRPAAETKKVKPQTTAPTAGWGGNKGTAKAHRPESHSTTASNAKSTYTTPDSIPVGSSYGPIRPGETLYSIAKAARPSEAMSVHDMMRMIFNANRHAFSRGNMSNLMAGTTLYIPVPGKSNTAAANTKSMPEKRQLAPTVAKKKSEPSEVATLQVPEETPSAASENEDNINQSETDTENNNDVITQTPGSAAAQLIFGSENESTESPSDSQSVSTEMPAENAVLPNSQDESVAPVEDNTLALDSPESIETDDNDRNNNLNITTETELPPPVVDMPETDNNNTIVVPTETSEPEPVAEQPVSPVVSVQENIKSAPSVSDAQPVVEDKPFFALPIPLLAGGLAGILALGGLALFFWRKRKNSDKDDVEEFSQEDIDRMVAEMEAEHEQGDLDFDALSAAIDKGSSGTAESKKTDKAFSDSELPENFGLTDDELSDDFFKDMEISGDDDLSGKGHNTSTAPVDNISLDKSENNPEQVQYSEDDFFADLEFNQSGNPEAVATTKAADSDDMDFLTDLSKDLEGNNASSERSDRTTASSHTAEKSESVPDSDMDFFADSDDGFFADEPDVSDKQQENTDSSSDDLDFFAENMSSVSETEKEEQASASTSVNEDLDFFLDEFPDDTKEEQTEQEIETKKDNLDFFMDDDLQSEESAVNAAEDASAGLDFFVDEDLSSQETTASVSQNGVNDKEEDASVDFFSEEETEIEVQPETSRQSDNVPNDIQNLFDDEDSAVADNPTSAVKAPPKPAPAPIIDTEAMEINLDMATSFIAMGKNEKARSWLEEVLEVGTEEQKERAKAMLAQINKA